MSTDRIRQSPYIALGLEFGASAAESVKAFARRLAQVRAGEVELSKEDLNWARGRFNKSEELKSSMEFLRVPTGMLERPKPAGDSLFLEGPVPIERRTRTLDDADFNEMFDAATTEIARSVVEHAATATVSPYPTMEST